MQSENKLNNSLSVLQEIICGNYSDETLFQAFQLLQKILINIAKNPNEEKFKNIKKTNPALQKKLFSIAEMERFFEYLGFVHVDDALVYRGDDYSALETISTRVGDQAQRIQDRNTTPAQKEELAKQKFLEERRLQLEREMQAKHEEEQRIKNQMEADKKEQAKREKAHDSHGNTLTFGANNKTFKDIGIDLCAQKKS